MKEGVWRLQRREKKNKQTNARRAKNSQKKRGSKWEDRQHVGHLEQHRLPSSRRQPHSLHHQHHHPFHQQLTHRHHHHHQSLLQHATNRSQNLMSVQQTNRLRYYRLLLNQYSPFVRYEAVSAQFLSMASFHYSCLATSDCFGMDLKMMRRRKILNLL